jgi:hypothetical protein
MCSTSGLSVLRLDPRSVAVAAALFSALMTLLMAFARLLRPLHRGFGAWTLAQLAFLVGVALVAALRGVAPDWASIVLGNLLWLASSWLVVEGFRRFHGLPRRFPAALDLGLVGLAGGFLWAAIDGPANPRIAVVGALHAFFYLRAGLAPLAVPEARRSPAQRALTVLCVVAGVFSLGRAGWALVSPPFFDLLGGDSTFLAAGAFATLVNAAGVFFVLFLNFERSEDHLRVAVSQVRTLSGLLPICATCKKVRDDRGYWERIETFLADRSELEFSHGICPTCFERLYPGGQTEG